MSDTREYTTANGVVTIGQYQEGDLQGCLDLFKVVFGLEKDERIFRWQFLDNPLGTYYEVGKDESGRIVSQYCSIPVNYWINGASHLLAQPVDTIVHPDHRGGLKRSGLFVQTYRSMIDRFCGPDGLVSMMGVVNREHYRIGCRVAGYIPMGRVHLLSREIKPDDGHPEFPVTMKAKGRNWLVQPVARFGADHDALWERLKHKHHCIANRDASFLNWRYLDFPDPSRYVCLELRDETDGALYGIAVGTVAWENRAEGVIADWFVDDEIEGARETFLKVIERLMAQMKMPEVRILLNPVDPEARFFEDRGYDLRASEYRLVGVTYAPEIVTENWLTRNWSYRLGDFDSV